MLGYVVRGKVRLNKVKGLFIRIGNCIVFDPQNKELIDRALEGAEILLTFEVKNINLFYLFHKDVEKIKKALAKENVKLLPLVNKIKALKKKYSKPEMLSELDRLLQEVMDRILK